MARPKPSRARRDISPTHQGAAGIDIGATMHVAAVGPEQDPKQCVLGLTLEGSGRRQFGGVQPRYITWSMGCSCT